MSVSVSLPNDTLKSSNHDDPKAEARRAKKRAYYQAHPEKQRAYTRTYKQRHPEQIRVQNRTYRAVHGEALAAKKHARAAVKRAERGIMSRATRPTDPEVLAVQREERRAAQAARARAHYAAHREKEIARQRAYRATHPGHRRLGRPLTDAERLQYRQQRRAYYAANRERLAAYAKTYRAAHPATYGEPLKAKRRAHYAANRERVAGHNRAYRMAHPEANSAAVQRYRAARNQARVNDLTPKQWLEIQVAYDHRCVYCHKRCKGRLTQDHILPISKGGPHTAQNVVPACQSCNSKKHAGPPPTPVQPLLFTIAAPKPHKPRTARRPLAAVDRKAG
jgi:5-methylcytosine-specific restriction endonuclease McrA